MAHAGEADLIALAQTGLSDERQASADMTGTTRYSVIRILSDGERIGLIETGRRRVTISNLWACAPSARIFLNLSLPVASLRQRKRTG